MRVATFSLFAVLTVQQAAAQFADWTKSTPFTCPDNVDNSCQDQQSSGWTFDDLPTGSFSSYSSFSFDGFSCSGSFGKRDAMGKRSAQYGGKAITGSMSTGGGPSFACGSSQQFSSTTYQVSLSRDADVEFQYTMEDGSTCSQVASCKASGSTVTNSQCGGAKSVTFKLPSHESGGCDIGIHGIGFDCSPPKSPPKSQPSPPPASPPPASPPPASPPPASPPPAPPRSSQHPQPSSPPESSPPNAYSSSHPPRSRYSSSVPWSYGSSPSVSSPPESIPTEAPPAPTSSSSDQGHHGPGSPPMPTSNCPDVLPKCLNTWLYVTNCKDNSDSSCFCKDAEFVSQVYGCMSAWEGSSTLIQAAISYFVGVCAPYVGQNPGIITNCPSSIPISPPPTPTPSPETVSSSAADTLTTEVVLTTVTTCPIGQTITQGTSTTVLATPSVSTIYITSTTVICDKCSQPGGPVLTPPPESVPYTTITVQQTRTVPCTYSTGPSAGQPIPSSSTVTTISSQYTIPHVQFTTCSLPGSTSGVMLAPPPTPGPQQQQQGPSQPTIYTSISPNGNYSTTSGPLQFQGAATKFSGSSLAGLLAIFAAMAFAM